MALDVNKTVSGSVCMNHFSKESLLISEKSGIRLRKGSIPTIVNETDSTVFETKECDEHEGHKDPQYKEIPPVICAMKRSGLSDDPIYLESLPTRSTALNSVNKCCQMAQMAIAEKELIISNMKIEYTQEKQQYESKIQKMDKELNELKTKIRGLKKRTSYLEKTRSQLKDAIFDIQKNYNSARLKKMSEVL